MRPLRVADATFAMPPGGRTRSMLFTFRNVVRRDRRRAPDTVDSEPEMRVHNSSGVYRRVALVGHFTPPVHGMAVAMDALSRLLTTLGPLVRIRTVPPGRAAGRLYHLKRAYLVARAALRLSLMVRRCDIVLMSVDAGKGMLYVIALTWIARKLGYRVVLQHHSYAYISNRSRLAATLVNVGGARSEHLHSCESACNEFRQLYPRARITRVLSVAYALERPPTWDPSPTGTLLARRLAVGHLSNLTLEKGLDEVIRFGRAAMRQGWVGRVILAGPATGRAELRLLDGIASEDGFEYRGPLTGQPKEEFFRDIDVFIFPTRYRNESFGLVAWEAMLRGVPIIAYRAGCLTQASAGTGGLVLEPGEDFTTSAMRLIEHWAESPMRFAEACTAVAAVARRQRERAISDALLLGAELFGSQPRGV